MRLGATNNLPAWPPTGRPPVQDRLAELIDREVVLLAKLKAAVRKHEVSTKSFEASRARAIERIHKFIEEDL